MRFDMMQRPIIVHADKVEAACAWMRAKNIPIRGTEHETQGATLRRRSTDDTITDFEQTIPLPSNWR